MTEYYVLILHAGAENIQRLVYIFAEVRRLAKEMGLDLEIHEIKKVMST